jgi:hypothetical protein
MTDKVETMRLCLIAFLVTSVLYADDTLYYLKKPFMVMGREKDLQVATCDPQEPRSPCLDYFPDEGTSRLPSSDGTLTLLLSGGVSSWLLEGGNTSTFTSFTKITEVMRPISNSSWENGYAGMSGVWINSKGRIWGFYHAEDHVNLPTIPGTSIPGFYASVGVAVSNDTGRTWIHRKRLLVAKKGKIEGSSAPADQGVSEPGVVADTNGKFVYILYTDHTRLNSAPVRICAARIPIEGDSLALSRCFKWDGSSFCQPCSSGNDIPVLTGSDVMGRDGDVLEGHPVWCENLGRFLMTVGTYDYTTGNSSVGMGGMWLVSSTDLVKWSMPIHLTNDWALPFGGKSMRWESSIIWTDQKIGTGWLVYGKTEKFPDENGKGEGAHMVGCPFKIVCTTQDFPLKIADLDTKRTVFMKKSRIVDIRGSVLSEGTGAGKVAVSVADKKKRIRVQVK